ncbi:P-loop containing nucleoside triphosphate hydrolases superfamily protein [Actinidia rufa]|uniref:P-loop containing nucleoside triphosphate hydrolases superfamily protein n=1 Tax=Actinidia rufa TaxID=165716 RepID=A0A7J0FA85_9ERIC|nr:P-loop containing nucleoside triphosphate hydrolases superfamily protein [Actinidia rufa]
MLAVHSYVSQGGVLHGCDVTYSLQAAWKLVLTNQCNEADGFYLPTIILEDVESVSQNDLLLLSEKQFGEGKELPTKYAFALVEHRHDSRLQVTLRMHLSGEVKQINADEVESCPRLLHMRSLVSELKKPLHILKICSLSTIVREYVALRSISSLPFKDLILAAAEGDYISEDRAWEIPRPLMESIANNHNKSQLDAIHGPPGTGKTQTILGLLSAILHAIPARVNSKYDMPVSSPQSPPAFWLEMPLKLAICGITHGVADPPKNRESALLTKKRDGNAPQSGQSRVPNRDGSVPVKSNPPSPESNPPYCQWGKASPWLSSTNPRDAIMPENGDDGFFPTTGNELKPEVVNSSRKYRVRVLVCAPSNSALDEIVLRLLTTGIRDENNRAYNPKIVRIGLKPHHSVHTVSMDYLVEQKLAGVDFQTSDKQKHRGAGRERDSIRASILDEAAIVFSTLSFSGSVLFSKLNRSFDVVIIDEAAQAVEPATLVPLANGCKQVYLVGDPVQLPATVISSVAEKFGYGMSLFKRFQRAGYPVVMLKTQYRMHPEIRSFPSREFYNGALEDGSEVINQTRRSWHEYRCFGPFCFFDIHEGKESQPSGSGSWVNEDEVDFVLAMYHSMVTRYPELKSSSRLAIISPYRHQVKLFRERFRDTFGVESDKLVDINTVDGFQGREKDLAIFSCVRASKNKGIGFVADFRRMNVGITRARSSVLVVGSASTLKRDKHWKSLLQSAEERNSVFKDKSIKSRVRVLVLLSVTIAKKYFLQVSKPYRGFFSDENIKSMEARELLQEKTEAQNNEMEVDTTVPIFSNPADVDQGPADDPYDDDEGYDLGIDED